MKFIILNIIMTIFEIENTSKRLSRAQRKVNICKAHMYRRRNSTC